MQFLDSLDAETVHLVGHSLGGILIRVLWHDHPRPIKGRVVTLATPHGGCLVAQRYKGFGLGRSLMGRSIAQLNSGELQGWTVPSCELGVISGTRSLGMARILYPALPRPNDGLLMVSETTFPGASEHLVLPVSHTGIMFSSLVAHQVVSFLNTGRFVH